MTICIIEKKSFEICWSYIHQTGFIRITTRGFGYLTLVEFRDDSIPWLIELFQEARRLPVDHKLVKTRDKGDRVLVFQRKRSDRGGYVIISVTPRTSRGRHVIIPEDRNALGWENFAYILQRDFLPRNVKAYNGSFSSLLKDFPGPYTGNHCPSFVPKRWGPNDEVFQKSLKGKHKDMFGDCVLCVCVERVNQSLS